MTKSIAVHLYINNVAVNVYNLTKRQSHEFRRALLNTIKPANKHRYLELDLDSNEEYGILTCTDESDTPVDVPNDISVRVNKYMHVPVESEWKTDERVTVLMSILV
jgi:hypothetical protein